MNLLLRVAWDDNKNIGAAYNREMESVGVDDWVCFLDMDAMHTSHIAPLRIKDVIEANPKYGMFSCMTNRVGTKEQVYSQSLWDNDSIDKHWKVGEMLWELYGTSVKVAVKPISGVMILTSKRSWIKSGGFKDGLLGVDNEYHYSMKKAGIKTGIMEGIYVLHYYRNGDINDTKHLL